ncbi:hypothetical protein KIH39_15395 [Telmatocola sphagniphila]|uniref:ISL3 family transposase n=1 Tax=Telmatocola sphagniphila TaxID=1123043 RepID=A0A8E6B1T9_9BACT|nr:hypothetical protein [Telmatocola sphagniphila]QVL30237.1 hypothetical protein KIH39_15395 [Telmatocola sphagniphila]
MIEITNHHQLLLVLDSSWHVERVNFSLQEKKVEIELKHLGGSLVCPECKASCPQADLAPVSRTEFWSHL